MALSNLTKLFGGIQSLKISLNRSGGRLVNHEDVSTSPLSIEQDNSTESSLDPSEDDAEIVLSLMV